MNIASLNKRQFLRGAGGLAALTLLRGEGGGLLPSLAAQTPNTVPGGRDNRIARVTATAIAVPCEYRAGSYKRSIRMTGVVAEVETADGLTCHGFSSITNDEIVAAAIRDVAAPYLKG